MTEAESSDAPLLAAPPCHPDSSVLPNGNDGWKKSISFDALGWRLREHFEQAKLLPGDTLDIAFTLTQNDHPDFGGLELSLRDYKSEALAAKKESADEAKQATPA
jgi:hypothetical protein